MLPLEFNDFLTFLKALRDRAGIYFEIEADFSNLQEVTCVCLALLSEAGIEQGYVMVWRVESLGVEC